MSAVSSSLRSSSLCNNNNNGNKSSNSSSRRRLRTAETEPSDNGNLVKLCINKPKSWNWELTTSRSTSSIAFPTIQLYDKSSGALLAETSQADCQIRGKGSSPASSSSAAASTTTRERQSRSSSRLDRRTVASIPEIIAESRDEELLSTSGQLPLKVSHCRSKSWHDDEISKASDKCKKNTTPTSGSYRARKLASVNGLGELLDQVVDQYAREGVQCKVNYRGSVERIECQIGDYEPRNYGLGKSKSTTNVPVAKTASNASCASSSDRKKKKKYRRAHSVNSLRFSNSILERIREYKRTTSSSSSDDDDDGSNDGGSIGNTLSPCSTLNRRRGKNLRMVHSATDIPAEHAVKPTEEDVYRPKYSLRTSKAGTIVVCEESFRHRKVRRRPRSLTRHDERAGDEVNGEYSVFSPEKVKTKFEYIGRADDDSHNFVGGGGENASTGINRYQMEIDNIDKMLEKLKADEASAGKSTSTTTRRHKSLTNSKRVIGDGDAEECVPIRFDSHHSGDDLSIGRSMVDNGQRMERVAKRISFGKTTRLGQSTDCDDVGGADATGMDINDVDNLHGKTDRDEVADDDDDDGDATKGMKKKTVVGVKRTLSNVSVGGGGVECSDKDKCWQPPRGRKQVRRTRRSLSADCTAIRVNDLLSSSSEEEVGNVEECGEEDSRGSERRQRSRTRRRRVQAERGAGAAKEDPGSIHKLIVQGDQVVAINKSIAGLPKQKKDQQQQQQTGCLIEPTDQVLLRLVRRLASMQATTTTSSSLQHDTKSINDNPEERREKLSSQKRVINNYEPNALIADLRGGLVGVGGSVDQTEGRGCCNPDNDINNNINNSSSLHHHQKKADEVDKENMGSNVSRQSTGKGLSGRRSLSSGNIFNGKSNPNQSSYSGCGIVAGNDVDPKGGSKAGKINKRFHGLVPDSQAKDVDTCSASQSLLVTPPPSVNKRDRNKLCGSLPNYLDTGDENDYIVDQSQLTDSSRDAISARLGSTNDDDGGTSAAKVDYVTVATNRPSSSSTNNEQFGTNSSMCKPPSSPYNSSSGKGSITSSSNLGGSSSTFKSTSTTNDAPPNRLELKLPAQMHRVNFDTGCDQGYGSERSPEEEVPPPLNGVVDPFINVNNNTGPIQQQQPPSGAITAMNPLPGQSSNDCSYDFITKDCTFIVQITKGARGLGLSISGGVDSNTAFPGLIRIKRLFPHQAAWATGMQPGDIILEVNGQPLSGLTNYEALEVLRTAPNNITLTVCRPEDEHYRKLSPPSEPPRPPERNALPPTSLPLEPLTPLQTSFSGEFEIIMVKQQGSLGFTLRKEDESVLGHYVRALVRPPATDGIIKPGDKIVAVNDVALSPMSHEEAVIFLRQANDTVKLRLYRDVAQTPVAAMSPTNPEKGFGSTLKAKQFLRPEAINLLSDLAYRKQTTPPCDSSGSSVNSGTHTSPRRLKRGVGKGNGRTASTGQSTSDSEASTLSQGSFCIQAVPNYCSSGAEDTYTIVEDGPESADFESISDDQQYYRSEEIQDVVDDDYEVYSSDSVSHPNGTRKSKFPFSMACNGYELNNLDAELLDAPIYKHLPGVVGSSAESTDESQDFVSLPCETFLVACKTESDLKRMDSDPNHFHHLNPVYQSVQIGAGSSSKESTSSGASSTTAANVIATISSDGGAKKEGTKSLMKWKGVILTNEQSSVGGGEQSTDECDGNGTSRTNSQRSCAEGGAAEAAAAPGQINATIKPNNSINLAGYKQLSLELNRGWNCRLGFSLKFNDSTQRTYISAIYSDSVAARDGRLQIGDEIVRVNDESVESMSTSQIIDLLRIIRGAICLTVLRKEDAAPPTTATSKTPTAESESA